MAGLVDIFGYLINPGLPPREAFAPTFQDQGLAFDPLYVPDRHRNLLFTLPSWYRQTREDEGFSTPFQIDPRAYDFTGEQGLATYNSTGHIISGQQGLGVVTPGLRDRTTTLPYRK